MITPSLQGLEPKRVFEIFSDLCRIPHGSNNEKQISDYVRDFAIELGLDVWQDESYNLIIKKKATTGYENAPITVLQAHLDMVCEKDSDVVHDFLHDTIEVLRDGNRIFANGTTLGADDGTGVAFAMAVLESTTLPHPPLEIVLTTNEESGMTGIKTLDFSQIKGRVIINLDCSDAGIVVGCAGTATACLSLPIDRYPYQIDGMWLKVSISGLTGGHSGLDITKERGNANVLMVRFLSMFQEIDESMLLVDFNGGMQNNALCRESNAIIVINNKHYEGLQNEVEKFKGYLSKELKVSSPNATMSVQQTQQAIPFTKECTRLALDMLLLIHSGVEAMNVEVKDLPETSGNIGRVYIDDDRFKVNVLYRSCFDSKKQYVLHRIKRLAALLKAEIDIEGDSPEWEYKADNQLASLIKTEYEKEFKEKLLVEVSHGGNECGSFFRQFPDADIVCTGTQITGAHSPKETVLVSEIQKEWKMLCIELKAMKNYGCY